MILFDVEDAVGVARLNKEIMDFLAIAEPAVTMEIKEAANRGERLPRFFSLTVRRNVVLTLISLQMH